MANTLNIPEITMADAVNPNSAMNLRSARPSAIGTGGPLVVRITDHHADDNEEVGDDTDKMAIFHSRQYGQPWKKDTGLYSDVGFSGSTDWKDTVIYVNYDYSTFE